MNKSIATIKNYARRKGSQANKFDAVVFGERVDWLQERLGHAPKSSEVLEDAKDPTSPLHEMFNWDDAAAAESFRKIQASVLLSSLVVKVEIVKNGKSEEVDMPVRVVLRQGPHRSGGHHEHIRDVLADPEMRARMFENAANELISIQRRYSYVKELHAVFNATNTVINKKLPHLKKILGKGGK